MYAEATWSNQEATYQRLKYSLNGHADRENTS